MLESAYKDCLAREFELRGLAFEREVPIGVDYKGLRVDNAFRADFIVENNVVVEAKTVEQLLPVHLAQTLTYMRWAHLRVGLLFNFSAYTLRLGMKRLVL